MRVFLKYHFAKYPCAYVVELDGDRLFDGDLSLELQEKDVMLQNLIVCMYVFLVL